jgi:peptide/nickel transport system ATP-binding protein
MTPIVDLQGLAVAFPRADGGWVRVVDGVSLLVEEGQTVGVVGESGCGKTITALALLRLIPEPGRIECGSIQLAGVDVRAQAEEGLARLRGSAVGMVFQEPGQAFNPVRSIAFQVTESALLHLGLRGKELRELAVQLLAEVGLDEPERVAQSYPHQLSGGQRQRVLIASALAASPRLLIADEPTSALDTVSQQHLVELLCSLRERRRLSLIVISHDLPLVSRLAERVTVLYAGETVEVAQVDTLFATPLHPYTRALLESRPAPTAEGGRFATVTGAVPRPGEWVAGCRFAPRCPVAFAHCHAARPALTAHDGGRLVRCFLTSDAEEHDAWG